MATDTGAGFKWEYDLGGLEFPTVQTFVFKDSETLTKGDIANLESGEVDLAVAADTAMLGAVQETKSGTDSTTEIQVIVDPTAVYSVYDANARNAGATLDLSGATGAQTVTTSSEANFIVVANSTASERTLVRIATAHHALTD